MRVVLDTDVVVAGLRSDRGISRRLLLAALEERIKLLLSVPLILEYESVLTRPEQLRETGLTAEETGAILDVLVSVSEPVAFHFLWRPLVKDPSDEMVLETAVNGGADHLATFNIRHFRGAAEKFGIRVSRPFEVWQEIGRAKL